MSRRPANRTRRKAKQDRSRATVEVVLEAAARVLRDHGYAAATTNRIAGTAGVSVGTLYEYFANKEELFDALIRRELASLVAAVRGQPSDPAAPIDERIGQLIGAAMGAIRYGPEMLRALEQVPGARFRQRLAEARQVVVGFVADLLAAHRSELRVDDLELAAFVVVSAAEGVGGNATSENFDERLARELAVLVKVYLTGVDPRPARLPLF